ncbi:MAG: xdhC [Herminiimonas sp.]|nr:xdhC [Herminiimonas sp.]
MIPAWLSTLLKQREDAVLVTVAHAEGSVPRKAGARMLVMNAQDQHHEFHTADTIGGGHLEWAACGFAREMLADPDARRAVLKRLPLGPTLGQCCGGVVFLCFERIDSEAREAFQQIAERLGKGLPTRRRVTFDSTGAASLQDEFGMPLIFGARQKDDPSSPRYAPENLACELVEEDGKRCLHDLIAPSPARLFLFGAGHVGAAIVHAMAPLPCAITWVDQREHLFSLACPGGVPANVTIEATDSPEAVVHEAPPGASYLVATHSHALDCQLSEHILRRGDDGWFGLIGSRTKRIQFERRLAARGLSQERLASMVCPIGLPGIVGKEPAVIAIAVSAQLLQVWEAQQSAAPALPEATKQRA